MWAGGAGSLGGEGGEGAVAVVEEAVVVAGGAGSPQRYSMSGSPVESWHL